MSFFNRHFLDFKNCNSDAIYFLFDQISKSSAVKAKVLQKPEITKSVGLLFLENSTRTKMSFELASHDCGYIPITFDEESSSAKKGESLLDTLLTLQAMGVSAFVIRHGTQASLRELSQKIKTPILNAGEGTSGHPTQALLDAYTILKSRGRIEGQKVLIVGDVKFSRVAQSNLELLMLLGAEVAYCGPQNLLPENSQRRFISLKDGLAWADVVMALRPQLERHGGNSFSQMRDEFVKSYGLNTSNLADWKSDGVILHPGPYIREQEITSDVLNDPRCRIFDQVQNGRLIRRTLLALILGDL